MNTGGANFVWQKQSKNWFSFLKWPHTSVEGSTNVLFVVKLAGYKVEDHQQKAFIEKFYDQKIFCKKNYLINCYQFV